MNLLRRGIIQALDSFNLAKNFATTLYTGNGTTQSVVSDLDYVANDGLVWLKSRSLASSNGLFDTKRGAGEILQSDKTSAEVLNINTLSTFNADGFGLGSDGFQNANSANYVAWQFMKAQGFFDIVEYVGDGIAGRTVAIDLDDGSAVFGMAIVKNRDTGATNWRVQHKDIGGTGALVLDGTGVTITSSSLWNDTSASTSSLTLGTTGSVNANTDNFIAYVFAHNPSKGVFCGSYTGTGAAGNKVVTGFPVGWVLIKSSSLSESWYIFDIKRGIVTAGNDSLLFANLTNAESTVADYIDVDSDGFTLNVASAGTNQNTAEYIFMAIADPAQF